MALSTTQKRLIIALAFGFVFTLGYLAAVVIWIFAFYRDDPVYAVQQVIPYWPLQFPERAYVALGGNLYQRNRAMSWLLTLANIPLYGALAYCFMWLINSFRGKTPAPPLDNEPPPPPKFD